jgi:hypothetical protein
MNEKNKRTKQVKNKEQINQIKLQTQLTNGI